MALVHEAAEENDVEELRRLLHEEPGLLEAEDGLERKRPLHVACEEGALEAAQFLLDRGAAINARNSIWFTPLMVASEAGRAEVVSMLLQRGADPVLRCKGSWTALIAASAGDEHDDSDHVAVIRLLLEDGRVPINAYSIALETALWWACFRGHTERARVLLLEGRADHTIAEHDGDSPLDAARRWDRPGCIKLLEWFEGELDRASLLSKARAVVDATESISKAPEKVGAKTRGGAQRAREEAAPAWLRGRVGRGEALPCVEVVGGQGGRRVRHGQQEEEEGWAVLEFVVTMLKEDMHVELMEGLRLR